MDGEAKQPQSVKAQRVELILRELDSLPTLSPVALRLLELTSDEEFEANEVIDLVASDPALSSKVLALCRCHERGRASEVTTIDRAVLLLGFEVLRCAVLSVQVFEVIDGVPSAGGEVGKGKPVFDREAFWLHALGVAIISARIASRAGSSAPIRPGEAFVAGLLHDIGQLVLHVLLPESFDRVCFVAEANSASLDHVCRQLIGLDTHTAGKRLAEHWGLPPSLINVIWLNGQPFDALPRSCADSERLLIAIVTLADALVRHRYITPGAHWPRHDDLGTLCIPAGIPSDDLAKIVAGVHDEVADRAMALGLDDEAPPAALLRAISRANDTLARANLGMRRREDVARRQARLIEAVDTFHEVGEPCDALAEALRRVARSAEALLEARVVAAVYQSADDQGWRLARWSAEGRPFGNRIVEPPTETVSLASLVGDAPTGASAAALMPWLAEALGRGVDLVDLRLLPLPSRAGAGSAALLVEAAADELERCGDLRTLRRCWIAALRAGANQDAAAHLAEQLAEANRDLMAVQETLARSRTLATLGEVASGAAHEMNNPLAVISGRSQLLASRVQDPELRDSALEIVSQSHRLSDMITALRSFAEPVDPVIEAVDLADLVMRVVQRDGPGERRQPQVNTVFTEPLAPALIDGELIGQALGELVRNAVEAKGSRHIELRVQTDPLDDRLKIEVRDDGTGLSEHALTHAFDPFFSAKPAGRQPGLGLARARRYVEAHGGRITLANNPAGGAIATIWLSNWRQDKQDAA